MHCYTCQGSCRALGCRLGQPYTWVIVHTKFHFISPGNCRSNIALLWNRGRRHQSFHFILIPAQMYHDYLKHCKYEGNIYTPRQWQRNKVTDHHYDIKQADRWKWNYTKQLKNYDCICSDEAASYHSPGTKKFGELLVTLGWIIHDNCCSNNYPVHVNIRHSSNIVPHKDILI